LGEGIEIKLNKKGLKMPNKPNLTRTNLDIKWLANKEAVDASITGAKIANLALLKKSGIRVPNGFAYLGSRSPEQSYELGIAYASLTDMPQVRPIQHSKVAVRSSAIGEDGESLSYAGQHDTVLGIHSRTSLSKAIHTVRGSVASDRAKAYRAANYEALPQKQMPVLIQNMIDVKWMMVVFTQNPVSPRDKQFVLEYNAIQKGESPETLVSGETTPSTLMVSRRHPLSELKVDGFMRSSDTSPRLEPGRVLETLEMAQRVEELIDHPADIECCIDQRGLLWVLQARPISTIPSRKVIKEVSVPEEGEDQRELVTAITNQGI